MIRKKCKNRLFLLSDELIDKVFEYYNPYKERFERVMFTLSWNHYWHKYIQSCFYSVRKIPFSKYYFLKRKEDEEQGFPVII